MKVNLSIPLNVWNERSEIILKTKKDSISKVPKMKKKNENKNRQKIHMVWCGKEL